MNTQQRRLFFASATSNTNRKEVGHCVWKRCFRPCGWIAVILSAALLGCSSLTPDRVNVIAQIAGQAAAVGAAEWLAKHPEHRDSFNAVLAALVALQKAGNTNEAAYVELLSSLPTDALKGPDGELYVAGDGGLVVWDAALKKSVAVRGPATVPVVKATVLGLRRATGPKPPHPGKALLPSGVPKLADDQGRELVVAREMEGAPTNKPGPTRVSGLSVASTFDVTLNEHGIQQVNVKWTAGPGRFTVQRSEDGKPWEGYASVTNSGVWTTLWPAPVAVGSWRVVRQ